MKRFLFCALLILAMALPCLAADQPAKDPFTLTFTEIDQNSDGAIIIAEFVAVFPQGGKELMELADKDKDGKLTKEEFEAWQKKYGDQEPEAFAVRYVVLDKDKNGEVVADEFVAFFGPKGKEAFAKADKNHDGKLSKEEWEAWSKKKCK
ncbi:hypothetical protein AAU61_18015 [Desulfocarbo indianensis]|nr:hypothetical protein AAU61_18015 [Desulfocarbo indianensis]